MNRRYSAWLIIPLLLTAVVLVVLYFFNPETTAFYPVCPLTRWAGMQCGSCGGLRATHHLLHGNFALAWHYNPMIPCAMIAVAAAVVLRGNTRTWGALGILFLLAALVFTIMRNA